MAEKQARKKSATLSLRIDNELKAAAELAAAVDRRSLTAYIEKLIENDLRARTAAMPIAQRPDTRRGAMIAESRRHGLSRQLNEAPIVQGRRRK